jgi:hypothetical protein
MLGRYSCSENWYGKRLGFVPIPFSQFSDTLLAVYQSFATTARRTGMPKGQDKSLGHLTLLGLAKNIQTQKSPMVSHGANIVRLGFPLA